MKRVLMIVAIMCTVAALARHPASAQGTQSEPPRLRLVFESPETLAVGHLFEVQVWVEQVQPVYGVELHLSFDPAQLEALEVEHGDFFGPNVAEAAFVLRQEANNEAGTVDYAVSLLNPAPPVEGDGYLLNLIFLVEAGGRSEIRLKEDSMFGTAAGELVIAELDSVEVAVPDGLGQALAESVGETMAPGYLPPLLGALIVGLLVGGLFLTIRPRRHPPPE
ncbi:MAG: cohesin domain-containing protein [Anaerolineae bacterium]|nr:cohesin domain-containing protein [Anaerolineae bacterium]